MQAEDMKRALYAVSSGEKVFKQKVMKDQKIQAA
jgi:hypothetical protein